MRSMFFSLLLAVICSAVFGRVGFHMGAASNLAACPHTFRALEACERRMNRGPGIIEAWEEANEAKSELKRMRGLCGAPCAVAQ